MDGIRSYLKHAEMMSEAALKEAETQKSRGLAWLARAVRLKEFCRMVMEGMDWKPEQVRKLEGRSGSITLKANGGRQALELTDASLLPEEFYSKRVTIPGFIWGQVDTLIDKRGSPELWKDWCGLKVERIPHIAAIAAEMDKPCESCKGRGHDAESYTDTTKPCDTCGGSGKRGVAGCRLAPRGSHVSIL